MKEGKGKNSVSKRNNSVKTEKPKETPTEEIKVTKVDVNAVSKKINAKEIDEDFEDEDGNNKLIAIVSIAILVTIAVVIMLLVGCEKKEETPENKKEENKIVVPNEPEDSNDEDDEEDTKVTKVVVARTSTTTNTKKYAFTYVLSNNDDYIINVKEGNTAKIYSPKGYDDCKYYTDKEMSNEYDFSTKASSNTTIYMSCSLIKYTVVYDQDTTNQTTFTVEDDIKLEDLELTDKIFAGWFSDSNYSNEVTHLNKELVNYANSENVINIYGKVLTSVTITLTDGEGNKIEGYEVSTPKYTLSNIDETKYTEDKLLGFTTNKGSNVIEYKIGDTIKLRGDITLYAICGKAIVTYVSNDEEVTLGYTEEDIEEYDITEITPQDLGMEVPTYYIPVDQETLNSKKIVSDDKETLEENEVKISDVIKKATEGYTPQIDEIVEEKEKVFDGWYETEDITSNTNNNSTTAINQESEETIEDENAIEESTEIISENKEIEEVVTANEETSNEEIAEQNETNKEETTTTEENKVVEEKQESIVKESTETDKEKLDDTFKPSEEKETKVEARWITQEEASEETI